MNKATFKDLKNKLLKTVAGHGITVRISYQPIKRPYGVGVSGTYSASKKRINLVVRGNSSYLAILATLAHEIRHAQHHIKGLFKEYYNPDLESKTYRLKIQSGEITPPSLDIGQKAEDDCNLYAVKWLKKNGHPLNKNKVTYKSYFEPYPYYHTLTYRLHQLKPRL